MSTRPALDDRPPAYALPLRIYHNNLRPLLLVATFVGGVWSISSAVSYVKDRNDKNNSSRLNLAFLVLAIMYFIVFAIEIFGIVACYLQRIMLVRLYFYSSVLGATTVSLAQLFRLIIHFIYKSDIINSCTADQLQENNGSFNDVTQIQAEALCSNSWTNSTYWDIGLFLALVFISFFFSTLAGSYLHQLKNPQSLRTHRVNPNTANSSAYVYPLNTYPQQQPYGAGYGGGAPAYESNLPVYDPAGYIPPSKDEKESDHGYEMGLNGRRVGEENESNETVTLEPRDNRFGEGRV